MSEFDRECVIIVDEMSVEAGTQYDPSAKKIIGNVTFPSQTTKLAQNGMAIMLDGIATKWKQVVAYEFSGSKENTEYGVKLKQLVCEIIIINQNNESLCKHLTLNTSSEHPVQNLTCWSWPKKLYFFADVPHLFKNITQSLINNSSIILPDEVLLKHRLSSN